MDCLVIEITSREETDLYRASHPVISTEDFSHFCRAFRPFWDTVMEQVTVYCGNCNSFQVPTSSLLPLLLEPGIEPQDEDEDCCCVAQEIAAAVGGILAEEIEASDEEWITFEERGTPDLHPIRDPKGEYVYPADVGYPMRYRSEEIIFKLADNCDCCIFTSAKA